MQFDYAACALFLRIDDAGIERAGIDVQAYGSLVELARIADTVHWLNRIDGAGLARVHLHCVSGFDLASALLEILRNGAVILDAQSSDRDSHPAILFAMIVDGTDLSDLPADGYQFVERSLVDEISRVVLAVPGQIRGQGVGGNLRVLQKLEDLADIVECRLGEFSQLSDEVLD